jgi:hypothetical protein
MVDVAGVKASMRVIQLHVREGGGRESARCQCIIGVNTNL